MRRIGLLDLWRSVCVWIMLLYHAFYDMTLFARLDADILASPGMLALKYAVAGSFVCISGISVRLSCRSAWRGCIVLCAAALVTAVTALVGYPVAFGVLHLLGVCMLLYAAARTRLERMEEQRFAAACLLLFALSWLLTASVTAPVDWFYPLGLHRADFYSADYYPLLPWAFLFLFGTALGGWAERNRARPLLARTYPSVLTFAGRHSLVIYLLHQPLLYGLARLLWG